MTPLTKNHSAERFLRHLQHTWTFIRKRLRVDALTRFDDPSTFAGKSTKVHSVIAGMTRNLIAEMRIAVRHDVKDSPV